MAALAPRVRSRVHFAVRFASSAMRIAAVLGLLAGGAGTYGLFNLAQVLGTAPAVPDIVLYVAAALLIAFSIIYALVLWGFADSLILLADLDDAQRLLQREVADLVLVQRTTRGPFHIEAEAQRTVPATAEG